MKKPEELAREVSNNRMGFKHLKIIETKIFEAMGDGKYSIEYMLHSLFCDKVQEILKQAGYEVTCEKNSLRYSRS